MEIHVHLAQLDTPFVSSCLSSCSPNRARDHFQLSSYTSGKFFGSCGASSGIPSRCTLSCSPHRQLSVVSSRAIQNWQAKDCKPERVLSDGSVSFVRRSIRRRDEHREGHAGSGKPTIWVRSFVDEATATSAEVELNSQIESPERIVQNEQQQQPTTVVDEDVLDPARYRELQDEWDQRNKELDRDTEDSESDASSSDEYNYEDMRLAGERKEWSKDDLKKIGLLRNFEYQHADKGGHFIVRAMRVHQMKIIQELLVDSFSELMGGLLSYRPLLALTVRQYMRDRFLCLPNCVTLVGFYAPEESNSDTESAAENGNATPEKWTMVGTVELAFCDLGQADVPAGPPPPHDSPYLCNMAVSSRYRRRGLGRQLLKAAEELTVLMGKTDLYLHCRLIDLAPLNMYQGAGYEIAATDSILALLGFQRRRHLLHKRIAPT